MRTQNLLLGFWISSKKVPEDLSKTSHITKKGKKKSGLHKTSRATLSSLCSMILGQTCPHSANILILLESEKVILTFPLQKSQIYIKLTLANIVLYHFFMSCFNACVSTTTL